MENISWYDLHESADNTYSFDYRYPKAPNPQSYLGLLRARTGVAFELPSEVEWEFAANAGLPYRLKQPDGAERVHVARVLGHVERNADMTLRSKIVYLIWTDLVDQLCETRRICHITIV